MHNLKIIYQLALADFRERTRQYSYLITMLGVLFFGYLVITGKYAIRAGIYRPEYDSVWAGSAMAVSGAIMLSIFGFFLVKGSIKRDRMTGVGQIIASSRISGMSYIVSKFISNLLTLWSMIAALALFSFITLLFKNESGTIEFVPFIAPFIIWALPAMIFVASMAVLFENVKFLRGPVGNIIYFFMAEFLIVFSIIQTSPFDLSGASIFVESLQSAAATAFPNEKIGFVMGFVMFDPAMQGSANEVFKWSGVEWTSKLISLRLIWVMLSAGATLIASRFFDRFDPANEKRKLKIKKSDKKQIVETEKVGNKESGAYNDIPAPIIRFSFIRLALAETKLALIGFHWFWQIIALGIIVAQIAAPFDIARLYLVPAAMIWPIVIWSALGTREQSFNTAQLLYSSPRPVMRQLPAIWFSGVMLSLAFVSVMILKGLVLGNIAYSGALLIGAIFIPSAALFLGIFSGSKKLFEVLYLLVWYIGSVDKLYIVDLLATGDLSISAGKIISLGVLTIGFMILSFVKRKADLMK